MSLATAVLNRFAKATSVLLSVCCHAGCDQVYAVPRRVERRFAGVSHGFCPVHYRLVMAELGIFKRQPAAVIAFPASVWSR